MATPLVSRPPQCMSCIRCMSRSLGNSFGYPGSRQIRGKKTLAKDSTLIVRLRQSVPSYGEKHSVVPVPAGRMRNIWYPQDMAQYLTKAELRLIEKKRSIERNPLWKGVKEHASKRIWKQQEDLKQAQEQEREREKSEAVTQRTPALMEIELLDPKQATLVLERLIPKSLDFYRPPIRIAPPKRVAISPSVPSTSTISAAAAEAPAKPAKVSIYGSVSTTDIATSLTAILAEDEAGSRVVLTPEDISFVEVTDEADRVKHLGVFQIEVKLNGAADPVRRQVTVSAQE